jgi:arylsulfatase A-like enzyme
MGIKGTFLPRNLFLMGCLFIGFLFYFCIEKTDAKPFQKSKPYKEYNIVMIWIDTLRADHLNCYGYNRKTSPNLDKLALESIVFENNFTSHTVTLPSFMSIITSLYPASHGVLHIAKDKLSPQVKTLAQILKLYDYKGIWLGPRGDPQLDPEIGFGRGFDTVGIFPYNLTKAKKVLFKLIEKHKTEKFFLNFHTYKVHAPYMPSRKYKEKFTKEKREEIIENFKELEKTTVDAFKDGVHRKNEIVWKELGENLSNELRSENLFTENYISSRKNIVSFLKKKNKKYLWDRIKMQIYKSRINTNDNEIMNHLKALYDGEILEFDTEIIGPVIRKLKESNLYKKTIIIICSDHGEEFGEHGRLGHGETLYEEVIYVPLIIKVPWIKRGQRIRELTQTVDITPTILDLVDIPIPSPSQGKSLLPLINRENNQAFREYVFGHLPNEKLSIRSKDWKYILNQDGSKELYHLESDPEEERNTLIFASKLQLMLLKWEVSLPSYKVESSFLPHIDKKTQERIKKKGYW